MHTLQDLKTLFANEYGETSAPADTDTTVPTRTRYINIAREDIVGRRKWAWRKKSGALTTNGTNVLSISQTDFHEDGIVEDTFQIDGEDWTQIDESEATYYASNSRIFCVRGDATGWEFYFPQSIPDTGLAVTFRYWRGAGELADNADQDFIPFKEPIASLAVGKYIQGEGDYDEALPFLEKAEAMIDEKKASDKRSRGKRRFRDGNTQRGYNVHDVTTMY